MTNTNEPLLEVRNISVGFSDRSMPPALQEVSFSLKKGRFSALLVRQVQESRFLRAPLSTCCQATDALLTARYGSTGTRFPR
ncbi:hypothetical protein GLGCALEP_05741 [Pseudomonas sp. MM221]|nr:hypothetical protein GLGCALEP_05741 [Pseudomonas sp. MM221]